MYLWRSTILAALLGSTVVGPAAAVDCFPKIRAAEARQAAPKRIVTPRHKAIAVRSPVHRAKPVVRVVRVNVPSRPASKTQKFVESSFALQTRPIEWVRPEGCDKYPAMAIQSAPPLVEKAPAQLLLDEIAGPTPPPETVDTPEDTGSTFVGGGTPPSAPPFVGGQPPPGGQPPGGQPPVPPEGKPPILPPDAPPEVPPTFPPGNPPILPPGEPPIVPPGPPVLPPPPPEEPHPPFTPQPPQEPPPVTAVPEPATWLMLIGGFFFVGLGLRTRRAELAAKA